MSADRQRLTSAIRRIAKTDPAIRGLLDAADNKGGKPGSAGVGSSTDAESQRICCDGSTSGSANPGTEERDPDSSTQSGLDSTDPADLTSGDGTLSGVTDCATGEPVCFDGGGFIPPDGWDSPTDPPVVESYQEGYAWFTKEQTGITYGGGADTPEQSAERYAENYLNDGSVLSVVKVDETRYDSTLRYYNAFTGNYTSKIYETARFSCNNFPNNSFDEDFQCTETPPLETQWPSDGCVNLAIKNGTIVGSKYDPENDGSYSAPRDSIDLCSGTDQISLAPAANGGWKTINSTTNNGYLYDSSGKQIAHIDGNEYSDPTI